MEVSLVGERVLQLKNLSCVSDRKYEGSAVRCHSLLIFLPGTYTEMPLFGLRGLAGLQEGGWYERTTLSFSNARNGQKHVARERMQVSHWHMQTHEKRYHLEQLVCHLSFVFLQKCVVTLWVWPEARFRMRTSLPPVSGLSQQLQDLEGLIKNLLSFFSVSFFPKGVSG